jgi:flagellar secretion chaperone FliS
MTSPALRARYLSDAVTTASPGRLLVMLYERLVLDLTRAEAALRAGEGREASERLLHAQDIIMELRASLDMDVWDGAVGLAKLYGYLLSELIAANIQRDADRAAGCRQIVEPLLDAWRQAELAVAEAPAATLGA